MTQAEPNDALQALTAQIPDRGWRLAAKKRSGSDGEIGKNSDTLNKMPGGKHQSGRNKTKRRAAGQLHATSRHTPRTPTCPQGQRQAGLCGEMCERANLPGRRAGPVGRARGVLERQVVVVLARSWHAARARLGRPLAPCRCCCAPKQC